MQRLKGDRDRYNLSYTCKSMRDALAASWAAEHYFTPRPARLQVTHRPLASFPAPQTWRAINHEARVLQGPCLTLLRLARTPYLSPDLEHTQWGTYEQALRGANRIDEAQKFAELTSWRRAVLEVTRTAATEIDLEAVRRLLATGLPIDAEMLHMDTLAAHPDLANLLMDADVAQGGQRVLKIAFDFAVRQNDAGRLLQVLDAGVEVDHRTFEHAGPLLTDSAEAIIAATHRQGGDAALGALHERLLGHPAFSTWVASYTVLPVWLFLMACHCDDATAEAMVRHLSMAEPSRRSLFVQTLLCDRGAGHMALARAQLFLQHCRSQGWDVPVLALLRQYKFLYELFFESADIAACVEARADLLVSLFWHTPDVLDDALRNVLERSGPWHGYGGLALAHKFLERGADANGALLRLTRAGLNGRHRINPKAVRNAAGMAWLFERGVRLNPQQLATFGKEACGAYLRTLYETVPNERWWRSWFMGRYFPE